MPLKLFLLSGTEELSVSLSSVSDNARTVCEKELVTLFHVTCVEEISDFFKYLSVETKYI